MNRSESKYSATAVRMDEAFLALLEKKDFAYITVKEICETAGVNRSTFRRTGSVCVHPHSGPLPCAPRGSGIHPGVLYPRADGDHRPLAPG